MADELVLRLLEERIREGAVGPGGRDFKTRLQEVAARRFDQLPRYHVRTEGPDHSKRFFATVTLRGAVYGAGEGRSKKHAEQAAASAAWERIAAADETGVELAPLPMPESDEWVLAAGSTGTETRDAGAS
jgi:ribonuclease-3